MVISSLHSHTRWPGQSFLRLLHAAWREYESDYAKYFAAAMVYYALVSLVPLLLLLLAALGLLLRLSTVAATAEQQVLTGIENGFGVELRMAIEELLQQLQNGSLIASLVSLVGMVWAGSVLFRHLRMTFRSMWKHAPPLMAGSAGTAVRQTFAERAIAFTMVLSGGGLLLAALALIALTHWLGTQIPLLSLLSGWLLALAGPLLALITFALLFKFLPPNPLQWRDVWLAAVLCAIVWTVSAELLALYGKLFGGKMNAYGALGALLVLMLWMYVVSQLLFLGGELCKVVVSRRADQLAK